MSSNQNHNSHGHSQPGAATDHSNQHHGSHGHEHGHHDHPKRKSWTVSTWIFIIAAMFLFGIGYRVVTGHW